MHLRICRYCHGPLSLRATRCPACKRKTLPPNQFKAMLAIMLLLLAVAFGVLVYGITRYLVARSLVC